MIREAKVKSSKFYKQVARRTNLRPDTVRVYLYNRNFTPDLHHIARGRVESFFDSRRLDQAVELIRAREIQKRGRKPAKRRR